MTKKHHNLVIMVTFATIILSIFTSCTDKNELFEDPSIYATRAMSHMDTRNENGGGNDNGNNNHDLEDKIVIGEGRQTITKMFVANKVIATATLTWNTGMRLGSTTIKDEGCKITCEDHNFWASKPRPVGSPEFDGDIPKMTYSFTVYERYTNPYTGLNDTLFFDYTETFKGKAVSLKDPEDNSTTNPYSTLSSDTIK